MGGDDEVDVAGVVEAGGGLGALEVDAEEVVGEGFAGEGDEVVEDAAEAVGVVAGGCGWLMGHVEAFC